MPWRAVTVTTTIAKQASYNPKRASLAVYNNGSANIFASQDPTLVDTQGWVIQPGSSITLVRAEGDEPESDMYLVAASGSQNVRIQESVGEPGA